MRRREFIAGLGSAAAWPVVARAQQPAVMPMIAYFHSETTEAVGPKNFAAFHQGLAETGYVEGRNVAILYQFAQGDRSRLPELATDLVRRRVAVIAIPGNTPAALAAKAATTTIPIVFGMGFDPVQIGLVASLNRPGGNVTGFSEMNTEVGPKRFGLMQTLVPTAVRFGLLVNPKNPAFVFAVKEAQVVAAKMGRTIEVLAINADNEINAVFAGLKPKGVDAIVVTPDPMFYGNRALLSTLATRHAVPAIYWDRALAEAGGLMSYGSSVTDMIRQVGVYTGRILKGEKPADLPVLQPTRFEFVINLRTAKALGLTVPETLLATADEVIE